MTRTERVAAHRATTARTLEQTGRVHRAHVADTAATLKARTRAARMAGLESVTIHLPIGDATLIATALTEWAARGRRDEVRDAINGRKGATS